jgi:hypothetical protein
MARKNSRLPSPPPELSSELEDQGVEIYQALQLWLETTYPKADGRAVTFALSLQLGYMLGVSSAAMGLSEEQIKGLVAFVARTVHRELNSIRKEVIQ